MFHENFIATTAMSSFNNAALYSPFFAIVGFLTLPLLWIVYTYAHNFELKFGWNKENTDNQISFWSSVALLLWFVLFGGNYAVIRDGISLLPPLMSLVLFALVIIVVRKSIQLKYMAQLKSKKLRLMIFFMLLLLAGISGYGNLGGILLQIIAVLCGTMVGFYTKKNIPLVPWHVFILTMIVVLILMQPEFFRFGQLGNLTIVHLLGIIIAGFFAITTLTVRYVHARSRIHYSAYIKLKWLFRIVSLLAFVLFILTESVPVFVGFIVAVGLLEALSIYHSKNVSECLDKQAFAWLLICVGTLMICPMVSGLGALYLASTTKKTDIAEIRALL